MAVLKESHAFTTRLLLGQITDLKQEREQDRVVLADFMAHHTRKDTAEPLKPFSPAFPMTAAEAHAKKWPDLPPKRYTPGYAEWVAKNARAPTHQDYFPWGQHCMRDCPCGEGPDL